MSKYIYRVYIEELLYEDEGCKATALFYWKLSSRSFDIHFLFFLTCLLSLPVKLS